MARFWTGEGILRRKPAESGEETESSAATGLERPLVLCRLTAIGVGGVIGAGTFPPSGTVADGTAGPAVLVSFLVAVGVGGASELAEEVQQDRVELLGLLQVGEVRRALHQDRAAVAGGVREAFGVGQQVR